MKAEVQSPEGEEEVQSHVQDECDLEEVPFIDRHTVYFLQQSQAIKTLRCSSWDSGRLAT